MDEQAQERLPILAQKPNYNPWKYAFFGLVLFTLIALILFKIGTKQETNTKQTISTNVVRQEPTISPSPSIVPTSETTPNGSYLEDKGLAPSLDSVTDWLNSSPVSIGGNPTLIVFCTPTLDGSFCSAVVPFLKQWEEKYRDRGLKIIWINTPYSAHLYEAGAYRDLSISFMQKYSLTFPVGQDTDGTLKDAYKIIGWPDLIFIDRNGIRYQAQNVPPNGIANYSGYEESIIQLLDKE